MFKKDLCDQADKKALCFKKDLCVQFDKKALSVKTFDIQFYQKLQTRFVKSDCNTV